MKQLTEISRIMSEPISAFEKKIAGDHDNNSRTN